MRLNARSPSAAIVWWSWWMSETVGISTQSGCRSRATSTSSSRISCRRSGNVRTSKRCTVSASAASPSTSEAARDSCTSVSGAKPSGSEREAIENAIWCTEQPAATRRAIVPPQPNSPSSVCGASTSTVLNASIID